jgi:FkbM family methyltransferase
MLLYTMSKRLRVLLELGKVTTGVSRLWVMLCAVALRLNGRIAARLTIRVPVCLPNGHKTQFSVTDLSDLLVLSDVFVEAQYAQPKLDNPSLIIDAGSHIGASVVYFANRYPNCRVVGIEPSPSSFSKLVANTAQFPNVELHNVALTGKDGTISFYERSQGWASSIFPSTEGRQVEVRSVTLGSALTMLKAKHVDLVKLDIEGCEFDVLTTTPPDPAVIDSLVGEIHSSATWTNFTDDAFLRLLSRYDVETDQSGRDYVFRATPKQTATRSDERVAVD